MQDSKGNKIPQQGNNNFTEVAGDRVLKRPSHNGAAFLELPYEQQVKLWNRYYEGTIYATACITEDGRLSTPYIAGTHPTDAQRLSICEDMMQNGFIMVDCRDKRNFLVGQDGKIFPVDFGQMYTRDHRFYATQLKVVQKEIDLLKSRIANPPQVRSTIFQDLKPASHTNVFQNVKIYIEALEEYKTKLAQKPNEGLNSDKIDAITAFVADTQSRINQYNQGNLKAFDGYIKANEPHLKILAQNRSTRPIMYSIILTLMVVPAILGVIQLAITKGNSYLFVTAIKESEKRAVTVQNKAIETVDKLSGEKKEDQKDGYDEKSGPRFMS